MGQSTSQTLGAEDARSRRSRTAASAEVTWSFVRGTPPLELLKLPAVAQKKYATRSVLVEQPASAATNVYPCFRGGLLFRIVDAATGGWHFYNDTADMECIVEYHFGPGSKLEASPHATVAPSTLPSTVRLGLCVTMTVFPGETLPFISGASRVNGFRSVVRIAPLSDKVAQSLQRWTGLLATQQLNKKCSYR